MVALGNLLWFICGGLIMGLFWVLAGIIMFCTILGIPWGRGCFAIASLSFWPFGREAISRRELSGQKDMGTGGFGFLGDLIWFVVAGLWLGLGHALFGA